MQGLVVISERRGRSEFMIRSVIGAVVVGLLVGGGLLLLAADDEPEGIVGTWYDSEGEPVPDGSEDGDSLVLHVFNGPAHCGWRSVVFLHLAWPVGEPGGEFRQYLRDADGSTGAPDLQSRLDLTASLPDDAQDTGFRRGDWELWVSGDGASVYLTDGADVTERWPRATEKVLCA